MPEPIAALCVSSQPPNTGVPALSFIALARSTLFNIDPRHTREHLMRAVYEGIGYNLRWILENFKKDYGFYTRKFRIIGGGALNDAWMQMIADITNSDSSYICLLAGLGRYVLVSFTNCLASAKLLSSPKPIIAIIAAPSAPELRGFEQGVRACQFQAIRGTGVIVARLRLLRRLR